MAAEGDQDVLVSNVGPVEVDWPRALGYYGGIGLAVAAGAIELPVGIFIAAVPFFRMLRRPNASLPARAVSDVLEGASKPVGGDSSAVIRLGNASAGAGVLAPVTGRVAREGRSIWEEAKAVAGTR